MPISKSVFSILWLMARFVYSPGVILAANLWSSASETADLVGDSRREDGVFFLAFLLPGNI